MELLIWFRTGNLKNAVQESRFVLKIINVKTEFAVQLKVNNNNILEFMFLDYVCSLRDDTGTFADGVDDLPRFAWSDDIQSCWRFSYYGAKGNYNNFASFRDCLNFCSPSK